MHVDYALQMIDVMHRSCKLRLSDFDIPTHFRDGATFHGSHANYITWVKDALGKIDASGATGAPLKAKMEDLALFLRTEITKAYGTGLFTGPNAGKSLHNYFAPPFPLYK